MTRRTDRRTLLALGASIAVGARAWAWRADEEQLDALVRWIVVTPRERVLARAVRELRAGLTTTRLLAGTFVAAVREICPTIARFNHSALVVSSIEQLTASLPEEQRYGPVLWCLDHFKDAQETDARPQDWKLAPVDEARVPSPEKARGELVRALDRWNVEAADAAIAGFVRGAPLDQVFELVWEYGTRCQSNLGHKGIYAAMAHRSLAFTQARYAEDALRSLVASYSIDARSERAAPFEVSRELVDSGLALHADAAFDAGAAKELDDALATAKANDAPRVIAAALKSGVAASSAWDAIIARGARLVVADPGVGALHALTSANALHYIHRAARTERVRLLALLQASAWSCLFRESAGTPTPPTAAHTNTSPAPDRVAAALALVRANADDVHQFKVAAAAAEEVALANSHAHEFTLAALQVHVPAAAPTDHDVHARIREALATGG